MFQRRAHGRPSAAGAARLNGKRHPVLIICLCKLVPAKTRDLLRSCLQGDLYEGPVIKMGKLVRNTALIVPAVAALEEKPVRIAEPSHRSLYPFLYINFCP